MSAETQTTPQDLINEAERLGFRNVRWDDFDVEDESKEGFLVFENPTVAEVFFELLDDETIYSFEPGDYSVDLLYERLSITLQKLKSVSTTIQMQLFTSFVRNLWDVDEDGEDWQNRLGWAWHRLERFATVLGPEYEVVVAIFNLEYIEQPSATNPIGCGMQSVTSPTPVELLPGH